MQLDPDDDEAEERAKAEAERQAQAEIERGLQAQRQEIIDILLGNPPTGADSISTDGTGADLATALRVAIAESADLGVRVAIRQFEGAGIAFDWTLSNDQAATWAEGYAGGLITQIGETTQQRVQAAVAAWVESGASLDDLVAELAPIFGEDRALLIAQTESTRAYMEGNLIAWREAGYGESTPEYQPPLHPGCRCWLVIGVNDDGSADYVYRTNVDSRVCPVCSPHHNQPVGVARRADR